MNEMMSGLGASAPMQEQAELQRPGDAMDASPEEQALYEQFVNNALSALFEPKNADMVMKQIGESPDPKEGLATVAVQAVQRVLQSAEQNGVEVNGDILMAAGEEIVEALATAASSQGVHDFTEEETTGAFYRAIDMYRADAQKAGKIDPATVQSDMNDIKQMEASGALAQMVGGGKGGMA